MEKIIKIKIKGTTPLLMNNPKAMLEPKSSTRKTTQQIDYEKEMQKTLYKTKDGKLYIPNTAIKGMIINASAYKKVGKYSLRPLIAGAVRIQPTEVIITKGKLETDIRTVVIQRNRVMKARGKIENWETEFNVHYDDTVIGDKTVITETINEGGQRVGLLDFRPQKLGEFGMFEVERIEVVK